MLLVYAVGRYDHSLLRQFHHTQQYSEDFEWIDLLVKSFAEIHTTPNILTEVSNLGGKLGPNFFEELSKIIPALAEIHSPSEESCQDEKFRDLGLTDCTILAVAARLKNVVLTGDFALYGILRSRNVDAINFHHLRQIQWAIELTMPGNQGRGTP